MNNISGFLQSKEEQECHSFILLIKILEILKYSYGLSMAGCVYISNNKFHMRTNRLHGTNYCNILSGH